MPYQANIAVRLKEMLRLNQKALDLTKHLVFVENFPGEEELAGLIRRRGEFLVRAYDIESGLETEDREGLMVLTGVPPEEEDEIRLLIERLAEVLAQLQQADENLKVRVNKELADVDHELKRLKQGKKVLKGYGRVGRGPGARLIDRKG